MSDGKAVELRYGGVSNPIESIKRMFYEVNPKIYNDIVDSKSKTEGIRLVNMRINQKPNHNLRYNTLIDVCPDGCVFKESGPVTFSYGRFDLARIAFRETGTIGVPDVPFQVRENTPEGVKLELYNVLDEVVFVRDHPDYEGVKEYKGILRPDNLVAIFTKWVGERRVYQNEMVIYAKQYAPLFQFEDSDFVG